MSNNISNVLDPRTLTEMDDADVLEAIIALAPPDVSNENWYKKTIAGIYGVLNARSPVLLWEASSGRLTTTGNTVYNLNPGLTFDTYNSISVLYDNHGASSGVDNISLSSTFPKSAYNAANKQLQLHTISSWKEILIVSMSSFRISGGTSALGVKSIHGFL